MADDQENKLTLALFSDPPATKGMYDGWVAFPSEDTPKVTSVWQTLATEAGKVDWELALVETASWRGWGTIRRGSAPSPPPPKLVCLRAGVLRFPTSSSAGGGEFGEVTSFVALPLSALRRLVASSTRWRKIWSFEE
ncbi:hypothetical protein E2562_011361 [Oryza meyeriana var. granulata]|uniref:Uncharacterized protein n=1 Tax=Oryza meyeriana var. granulata TaxID=110450 RepID=A0A6G1BUG9_9ORYZ|nr:hypothetical protein E2562_011361 [Oryza meyeriana var. granulata]